MMGYGRQASLSEGARRRAATFSRRGARLQPVMAFLAAHLDADLSLAALAGRAGLSRFHLQRMFSAGMSRPIRCPEGPLQRPRTPVHTTASTTRTPPCRSGSRRTVCEVQGLRGKSTSAIPRKSRTRRIGAPTSSGLWSARGKKCAASDFPHRDYTFRNCMRDNRPQGHERDLQTMHSEFQSFDMRGRQLRYVCRGEGAPTILVEQGGGLSIEASFL